MGAGARGAGVDVAALVRTIDWDAAGVILDFVQKRQRGTANQSLSWHQSDENPATKCEAVQKRQWRPSRVYLAARRTSTAAGAIGTGVDAGPVGSCGVIAAFSQIRDQP